MAGAMLPGGAATIANGPCEARPGCFRSGGSDPHSATGYDGADRRPGHFAIGSRRPRTGESPDPDHDPRSSTFIDWRSNSAACGYCGHCSRSTTARFVKSLKLEYTYMNALTSLGMQGAKIPIYFVTDRGAIEAALASLAAPDPAKVRVVRIADTLNLERFQASEACVGATNGHFVSTAGAARAMEFDSAANLLPW
jgi:hypothetical protein